MKRVNLLIVALVLAISAPAAMGETSNLLVPIVISSETADSAGFGEHWSLHARSEVEFAAAGNYLNVHFPGDSGENDYRSRLGGGYDPPLTVSIGDSLAISLAFSLQTFIGLEDRLLSETDPRFAYDPADPAGSGYTAWNNWLASSDPITGNYPRTWWILTMPVVEYTPITGSENVVVVGFANFFIQRIYETDTWETDGIHYAGDIDGRFIPGAELEPIPEPSGLIALGGGMLALAGCILRRRSAIREGAARPAIIVLDKSMRA